MNTNLNSIEVSQYATAHNTDRYTAMAMIAAKGNGIRHDEMFEYTTRFYQNMNNGIGYIASIHYALKPFLGPQIELFNYQFSNN